MMTTKELSDAGIVRIVMPQEYRYRLKSIGNSSERYGPCEVCGKHCSEVWFQVEERKYYNRERGEQFTQHECNSYFGHKECLEAKQRHG